MTDLDQKILAAVTGLPAFSWEWHSRGRAPAGYLKGVALAFARVYSKLKAGDPSAKLMAQADREDSNTDALSWYSQRFNGVNYDNTKDGVDTLRHLFVLLTGLGMRESSGRYLEGRDTSADNTASSTAEAGLFQQSYDSFDGVGRASQEAEDQMNKIFSSYRGADVDGYLDVFKEGVPVASAQTGDREPDNYSRTSARQSPPLPVRSRRSGYATCARSGVHSIGAKPN